MNILLTDLDAPILPSDSDSKRAPGLHVSDLYNGLYKELEPERFAGSGGPDHLKMAMGLAWENYWEQQLRAAGVNVERPPERYTKDGIAFNPDGLINGGDRGVEYKLTYMADPGEYINQQKFAKWVTQMKAYGHHLEIPDWTLYALFVNGDYRTHRGPILRRYDFEFTKAEMREHWRTLKGYGRSRKLC